MSEDMKEESFFCSFCGKKEEEVSRLFAGGEGVCICDECVRLSIDVLDEDEEGAEEEFSKTTSSQELHLLPPKEIKAFLDDYVIGQDRTKKVLSVAVYNHYKRLKWMKPEDSPSKKLSEEQKNEKEEVEVRKSNILLVGATGSGKTLLAETMARLLNVPFAIVDATSLTVAGYVGEDVENIILKLVQAAAYDVSRAERGIIYIDEIDKITRKSENPSVTRDVSGEGVQQALLKIIEGTQASIPQKGGRKHPQQDVIQVNTRNILFICGGSFEGIEKIIQARLDHSSVGFDANILEDRHDRISDLLRNLQVEDLLKYGLIPEFVGRLPVVETLESLTQQDLIRIMKEPKNSIIKQYTRLLAYDQVELIISDEALDCIASKAIEKKTGARGLYSIFEKILLETMYELPTLRGVARVVVTKDTVVHLQNPLYYSKDGEMLDLNGVLQHEDSYLASKI